MKLVAFADERGYSLVEVLVSVAIVAIVITAFLSALSTGSLGVALVHERVTAENIARAQLELIQKSPYCIAELENSTNAVIIQPGPDGGKDTYILSWPMQNDNFGNDDKLVTGGGLFPEVDEVRSLLQFDLSSIPKEASVDSAALSLYLYDDSPGDVGAHRLTTDWVEGTGGQNTGATWKRYDGANHWDEPGGDYDPAEAGSFAASGTGWKTMDLTSLTQGWVNETYPNYGVILCSSLFNYEECYSSDYNTDPSLRPLLAVTYTVTTTVQCYPLVDPPAGYAVIAASSVITPGLEVITVTVSHNSESVFTIEDYKVDR